MSKVAVKKCYFGSKIYQLNTEYRGGYVLVCIFFFKIFERYQAIFEVKTPELGQEVLHLWNQCTLFDFEHFISDIVLELTSNNQDIKAGDCGPINDTWKRVFLIK